MSTSAISPETLLPRIRRETRDLHERLETELNFPGAHLTLDRYAEVLGRFYGFYVSWEQALEPWATELRVTGLSLRSKVPDLIRDLDFLEVDRTKLPVCLDVPSCSTLGEVLGNFYVREGSTLGGQYISRHLQTALGFSNGLGYQFFSSGGGDTVGREWKAFQKLLLGHSSPQTDAVIISAARSAFNSIRLWLCAGVELCET